MIAVTAFLFTLLILALIAGLIGYFLVRPAYKRISRVCDHVDELNTVNEGERIEAESELDQTFPHDLHTNT
jgi:hypothetical protein